MSCGLSPKRVWTRFYFLPVLIVLMAWNFSCFFPSTAWSLIVEELNFDLLPTQKLVAEYYKGDIDLLREPHQYQIEPTHIEVKLREQIRQTRVRLSYRRAKEILYGFLFLQRLDTGEFGLEDVYCETVLASRHFLSTTEAPLGLFKTPSENTINVEHSWPQRYFSRQFDISLQKADLHHIFPANRKINSLRSSFAFGKVVTPQRFHLFGTQASRFGFGEKPTGLVKWVFEPPPRHRGRVARALFYFATAYNLDLIPSEASTLQIWNQEYPPDEEEVRRNDWIQHFQGNRNPFIDFPNLVDYLAPNLTIPSPSWNNYRLPSSNSPPSRSKDSCRKTRCTSQPSQTSSPYQLL